MIKEISIEFPIVLFEAEFNHKYNNYIHAAISIIGTIKYEKTNKKEFIKQYGKEITKFEQLKTGLYTFEPDGRDHTIDLIVVDEDMRVYKTTYNDNDDPGDFYEGNKPNIESFETRIYELYEIQKIKLKDVVKIAFLLDTL